MPASLFSQTTKKPQIDGDEQRALVALSLVPGVGTGRTHALLTRFASARSVMRASPADLTEAPGIGRQTARAIKAFEDWAAVDDQFRRAEREGVALVPVWDDQFPATLREIYDPPAFLWMKGDLIAADERAVAIVGTRRATDYGKRLAHDFAEELARQRVTIVSGLAYGIDAAAHRGALKAGGRTLAVLGSGVDNIYPVRNTRLSREIVSGHGAVLSEFPLGADPDAPNFPRRNRIVSGLSLGIIVVEAYATGGALITARLAVEQNREVFAIPSSVHSRAGVGSNHLIQRGHARLVLSPDDVLEELGIPLESDGSGDATGREPLDLHPVEERLYDALGPEPVHIDALCQKLDLDASSALVHLLNLEFQGCIRQLAGKQFFRVG